MLTRAGAQVHNKLDVTDNNVLGVPYPSLVFERLLSAYTSGVTSLLVNTAPKSLAPYDINGEVLRVVQR